MNFNFFQYRFAVHVFVRIYFYFSIKQTQMYLLIIIDCIIMTADQQCIDAQLYIAKPKIFGLNTAFQRVDDFCNVCLCAADIR
mgnify:CR=1